MYACSIYRDNKRAKFNYTFKVYNKWYIYDILCMLGVIKQKKIRLNLLSKEKELFVKIKCFHLGFSLICVCVCCVG